MCIRDSNYIRRFCIFFIIGWQLSTIAAPQPSGTQADGQFRKVILVSDKDLNGDDQTEDNLIDPMELSISKDGTKSVIRMFNDFIKALLEFMMFVRSH